ncbi:DUF3466 family protein [Methyloprofundus sp.]|uniref:DUF3466 family protein n=1 Tax=Methyloprofundus sp. TaxID=2020875 RepID=UPI003D100D4B
MKFKLTDIDVGGQTFRADLAFDGSAFIVDKVGLATHGKMVKGEQITSLGILAEGSFSYAYGISNDGTVISGRSRGADRVTVPVRFHYEDGHIEALEGLGGGRAQGRAVNNSGTIAGFDTIKTDDGSRVYHAIYNEAGSTTQDIGTLGAGTDSRAYGINNSGMMVGWSATLADNTDHVAFSYDTANGTFKPLDGDILGGERSFAFAINDSGQVAGVATTADGSALAFIYKDGVATNLGSLDDTGYSEARAINDKGQATGWSLNASGQYAAFISDGTAMTAIPGFGGDTKAYDINTHGHVVGDGRDADGGRHAFVYKDGQLLDLYEMLPAGDKDKWKELREAYSISDDGVVVGRGRFWTDKENGKSTSTAFRVQL